MSARYTLIFDGDDTLWENNIYFERAIDDFITYLEHSSLSRDEVRAVLDEIQHANVPTHGYGARSFAQSLQECFHRLIERDHSDADLDTIMTLGLGILDHPMEVIDGVEETLALLAERHRLVLLTKGQHDEQQLKIDRSALASYFDRTVIVPEKDEPTYHDLADELGIDRRASWMIGNSPKSDINPALAVGLNAVFIPHAKTWRLEHAELASADGRLLVVERFRELQQHFIPVQGDSRG